MPFDACVLNAVAQEIEKEIIASKARVHKVSQLNPTDILIHFRSRIPPEPLFISIHPEYARINTTKRHYTRPQSPPAFCMLLRKHLLGGLLVSLRQPPLERVLYLNFLVTNEYGKLVQKTLVAELMGRYSNLILLNTPDKDQKQVILGGLKQVPPSLNRFRTILPKHIYEPPPLQEKLHPYALNFNYFQQEMADQEGKPAEKALLDSIQGLSPLLAREIAARAKVLHVSARSAPLLWQGLQELLERYHQRKWEPILVYDSETARPRDYAALKLIQWDEKNLRAFSSMSNLLDVFYEYKERLKEEELLLFLLSTQSKLALNKAHRTEKKQSAELQKAENASYYRLCGELVLLNLKRIPAKAHKIRLKNIYQEEEKELEITLDPRISPSLNAQRYFKKYRKAQQGIKKINEQLEKTRREIEYLESVAFALEKADLQNLRAIKEELAETGYLPRHKKSAPPPKKAPLRPRRFISSQGEEIYVGRNNKENEYLALRFAQKENLWLHVKNLPGSHVIIKSEQPHQNTILEAALLAAYFSRSTGSSKVAVDYTKAKNVKRHPNGKPGMVTYSHHQTTYVTPAEETLKHLLKQKE